MSAVNGVMRRYTTELQSIIIPHLNRFLVIIMNKNSDDNDNANANDNENKNKNKNKKIRSIK